MHTIEKGTKFSFHAKKGTFTIHIYALKYDLVAEELYVHFIEYHHDKNKTTQRVFPIEKMKRVIAKYSK